MLLLVLCFKPSHLCHEVESCFKQHETYNINPCAKQSTFALQRVSA